MSKPHVNSSICENNFQFLNAASVILILDIFFVETHWNICYCVNCNRTRKVHQLWQEVCGCM